MEGGRAQIYKHKQAGSYMYGKMPLYMPNFACFLHREIQM